MYFTVARCTQPANTQDIFFFVTFVMMCLYFFLERRNAANFTRLTFQFAPSRRVTYSAVCQVPFSIGVFVCFQFLFFFFPISGILESVAAHIITPILTQRLTTLCG